MNGCDQCEVLTINGVACHETGCPNSWRHPATGEPLEHECGECGCEFTPEYRDQSYCDNACAEAGGGHVCWKGGAE